MVESQTLVAVRNVRASSRWYAELLAADSLPDHEHRDFYDRIICSGRLVLQLHAWDEEDHPNLVNADAGPPGLSVSMAAWARASSFGAPSRSVHCANPLVGPCQRRSSTFA